MDKDQKCTASAGSALFALQSICRKDGSGPIADTPTEERQASLMEQMGLAKKKNRSTTTSQSVTDKEGVRHSVSHTETDRGHSTKTSRSGFNEDGTKWEESTTSRESKQEGGTAGGVGRTVGGAAGKAGKAAVSGAQKALGAAADLVR